MATDRQWRDWFDHHCLPAVPPVAGRVVVLSAHPDDEVLGAGGWLAGHAPRDVLFCTATDGEASHPGSPTLSPTELAQVRAGELERALAALGHVDAEIVRLGLPDSGLASVRDDLTERVARLVADADLVLAPFHADGHTDHDTLGLVARQLCAGVRRLWEYPVWAWEWNAPEEAPIPWAAAGLHVLGAEQRQRKQAALACFTSQVAPLSADPADRVVLTPPMLTHALRPYEVFLL